MSDVFVPKEDPKTTPERLKRTTLQLIALEKSQQLNFLTTLSDAAILAGEQVQDKRLDLLEKPPPVSADAVLLDAFVSLALGSVGSLVVRTLANRGVQGILGVRAAVSSKNGRHAIAPFTTDTQKIAMKILSDRNLEELLDPNKMKFDYWRSFAEDVIDVPRDVAVDRARLDLYSPQSPPERALEPVGDTASVAVRRAALSWARLQRQATEVALEQLGDEVTAMKPTDSRLPPAHLMIKTARENREVTNAPDNGEVELQLSLLFEAAIWIRHFGSVDNMVKKERRTQPLYPSDVYIPGPKAPGPLRAEEVTTLRVDERLLFYWLQRFRHPADPRRRLSFVGYHRSSGFPAIQSATKDLLQWFRLVEHGIESAEIALRNFGFDVLGPVKFK